MSTLSNYSFHDFLLDFSCTLISLLVETNVPTDFVEILKDHSDHLLDINIGNPGIAAGFLLASNPPFLFVLHALFQLYYDPLPFHGVSPTCAVRRRFACTFRPQSRPCVPCKGSPSHATLPFYLLIPLSSGRS